MLEEIRYANPHVTLKIRSDDGILYTALWETMNGVQRRGGTRTTFKAGDRVKIVGCPPRDVASREIALLRQVTRIGDGWTWRIEWPVVTADWRPPGASDTADAGGPD